MYVQAFVKYQARKRENSEFKLDQLPFKVGLVSHHLERLCKYTPYIMRPVGRAKNMPTVSPTVR